MSKVKIKAKGVVCVLIKRDEGKILLMKRSKYPADSWCYVAGSIEEGETAWETAIREVKEETGMRCGEDYTLYSGDTMEQLYNTAKDYIWIAPVFVALVHSEKEVEINHEHTEYRWMDIEEALKVLSFPEQKRVVRHIEEYFIDEHPTSYLKIQI